MAAGWKRRSTALKLRLMVMVKEQKAKLFCTDLDRDVVLRSHFLFVRQLFRHLNNILLFSSLCYCF